MFCDHIQRLGLDDMTISYQPNGRTQSITQPDESEHWSEI
jgi:hypothetical protein